MANPLRLGLVVALLVVSSAARAQTVHAFGAGDVVIEHGDTVTMIWRVADEKGAASRADTTKVLLRSDSAFVLYPLPRRPLALPFADRVRELVRMARQSDHLDTLLAPPRRPTAR